MPGPLDVTDWDYPQDWDLDLPSNDWDGLSIIGITPPVPSFAPAEVWDPPRLRAAIHASHTIVTRARVMEGRHAGTPLRIVSGSVTVDLTQSVRRTAQVTLVDPTGELVVDDTNDLLAPLGPELLLERGVRFSDGSEMYVGQGVFGIYDVDIDTDAKGGTQITLQLFDRSRRLAENGWLDPYQVTGGIDFADAIEELITNRMQKAIFAEFRFQPTGHLTGPNFIYGADNSGDPNQDVGRMAASIGFEVVPSPLDGVWELRPIAKKTDVIVDVYAPGEAKLLKVKKNWTREDTYSIVKVTGERSGHTPVQSIARDDDPESPTYYKGLFGPKTFEAPSSEFITTQDQADAASAAWLNRKSGASELLEFESVVDPLLDAGDVIRVENTGAKVDARYLVESFTIPFGPTETLRATCRKRRITT